MTEGLLNPRFSGTNFENIFSVCPIQNMDVFFSVGKKTSP